MDRVRNALVKGLLLAAFIITPLGIGDLCATESKGENTCDHDCSCNYADRSYRERENGREGCGCYCNRNNSCPCRPNYYDYANYPTGPYWYYYNYPSGPYWYYNW